LAHTPCCNAIWHTRHVATLFGTHTMLQRFLAHTPCCNAIWHTRHVATLFDTHTLCCNAIWHTHTMLQRYLTHTHHVATLVLQSLQTQQNPCNIDCRLLSESAAFPWHIYEQDKPIVYRLVRYFLHSGLFALLNTEGLDYNLCPDTSVNLTWT